MARLSRPLLSGRARGRLAGAVDYYRLAGQNIARVAPPPPGSYTPLASVSVTRCVQCARVYNLLGFPIQRLWRIRGRSPVVPFRAVGWGNPKRNGAPHRSGGNQFLTWNTVAVKPNPDTQTVDWTDAEWLPPSSHRWITAVNVERVRQFDAIEVSWESSIPTFRSPYRALRGIVAVGVTSSVYFGAPYINTLRAPLGQGANGSLEINLIPLRFEPAPIVLRIGVTIEYEERGTATSNRNRRVYRDRWASPVYRYFQYA